MSWVRGIMPTCQEMTRLLSDALDRSLPLHVRMRMQVHLVICTLCQRYQSQVRLIRQMLRTRGERLEEVRIPQEPCLSPEAKQRLQRALDAPWP